MAQGKRPAPWSDLTTELLGQVFLRLPTRADRASFPAVCRAWCSAARQCRLPLPSPVPWLVLPDNSATSFPRGETFQLPDGVRYHNSYGEWLLLSRGDQNCLLMNPFTKATMPLPSLHSYSYYQERVDFAGDHIDPQNIMAGSWRDVYNNNANSDIYVKSLVVGSARLIAAIVTFGGCGTIALCRSGDVAWSVSAHDPCRWISNMVFFQGKLYALDTNIIGPEGLISIDIVDEHDSGDLRVSRIERHIEGISLPLQHDIMNWRYLVESHGTLLMIRRKLSCKTQYSGSKIAYGIVVAGSSKFEVFKVDFEKHLWAEMKTLGNDQAIFLGRGCSRAVHVSPNDLSRDCVFFLDDYTNRFWKKTITSCRLYDMKDENVYAALPMLSWRSGEIPATWIFSQRKFVTVEPAATTSTTSTSSMLRASSTVASLGAGKRSRKPNRKYSGADWVM